VLLQLGGRADDISDECADAMWSHAWHRGDLAASAELLRVLMSLAHRRICGLCGRAFAIVRPPDEEETERDKLCPACVTLPPGPQGADDQPA
jgi:hypothetical protein